LEPAAQKAKAGRLRAGEKQTENMKMPEMQNELYFWHLFPFSYIYYRFFRFLGFFWVLKV
jgi:hypothetical protein